MSPVRCVTRNRPCGLRPVQGINASGTHLFLEIGASRDSCVFSKPTEMVKGPCVLPYLKSIYRLMAYVQKNSPDIQRAPRCAWGRRLILADENTMLGSEPSLAVSEALGIVCKDVTPMPGMTNENAYCMLQVVEIHSTGIFHVTAS